MDRDAMGCWRNQGAIHGKEEELAPMEWESWATLKFLRAGEDSKGEELAARKGWRPWSLGMGWSQGRKTTLVVLPACSRVGGGREKGCGG